MNKKKILLIQPSVDDLMPSTYRPSLGLPYIAAELRTNPLTEPKTEIRILDFPAEKIHNLDFTVENFVSSEGPFDIVGVSIVSPAFKSAIDIATTIKKMSPRTILVAGGYHPSIRPIEVLKDSSFDIAVVGEGEKTFAEIAASEDLNQSLSSIKGVCFKTKQGNIVCNEKRPPVKDINELAFPSLDLMPLDKYPPYDLGVKIERYLPIITSRGCPYGCVFCSKQVFGRKCRMRSPENIVEEIEYLSKTYGISSFYFHDDTFTASRNRTERICDLIIASGLNIKWWCFARANLPKSLMKKMRDAGCVELMFGIESGDPVVLKAVKKNLDLEEAEKTIGYAHDLGILVRCFFIVGLPKQDEKSIGKTVRFIKKTRPDIVSVGILTPYPGTEILEKAEEYGIKIHEPETPNGLIQFQDAAERKKVVISTKWMEKGEILKLANKIYEASK